MKTYNKLYEKLCSYENLELAFMKARKNKTLKLYVIRFEKNLKQNLLQLQFELLTFSYRPQPLTPFIIRDPKTRKICKSIFRDRIIHHALVNILEPIFEPIFIHDSYAGRVGKGTLKAIERFDYFKRKVSYNGKKLKGIKDKNYVAGYCLKADIKHYFDTVDYKVLMNIIERKIKDNTVLWLIKIILANALGKNKGMPLGNLTSQFFANVYLNELDYFVKHKLKAKYYIRYVDDFVILHNSKEILEDYKSNINQFLKSSLKIELHPDKSKVIPLRQGINFLGFRNFYHYKLLRKTNIRKMQKKMKEFTKLYGAEQIDYDVVYDSFLGWFAYAKWANTYNLRKKIIGFLEENFSGEISTKEINKHVRCYHLVPQKH